jgi:ligand-binding SRPBCC domain-containing protein
MNLRTITPPWLDFQVDSGDWERMYPGMILQYRVRPLLGVPMRWVTEITHVDPKRMFVDEQRFGPYRMWHHEHHFRGTADGVEMTDIVHYSIGYGLLDPLIHRALVRHRLEAIFDYRFETLARLFAAGRLAANVDGVTRSA